MQGWPAYPRYNWNSLHSANGRGKDYGWAGNPFCFLSLTINNFHHRIFIDLSSAPHISWQKSVCLDGDGKAYGTTEVIKMQQASRSSQASWPPGFQVKAVGGLKGSRRPCLLIRPGIVMLPPSRCTTLCTNLLETDAITRTDGPCMPPPTNIWTLSSLTG